MRDSEDVVIPAGGAVWGEVSLPSSKSLTHRALALSALVHGRSKVSAPLLADDTMRMARALSALGIRFEPFGPETETIAQFLGTRGSASRKGAGESLADPSWFEPPRRRSASQIEVSPRGPGEDAVTVQPGFDSGLWVEGGPGALRAVDHPIDVGGAGTAMRFLTALASLVEGVVILDGDPRMRERPMGPLLGALRSWGVEAESAAGRGCPPIRVRGGTLGGGLASIRGDVSSQYISALLMIAPLTKGPSALEVVPPVVSGPYIDLTLDLMAVFGTPRPHIEERSHPPIPDSGRPASAEAGDPYPSAGRTAAGDGKGRSRERTETSGRAFRFRGGGSYTSAQYSVPPDASSASYFFAAPAVAGGRVTVRGLKAGDPQGDMALLGYLEEMGCAIEVEIGAASETGSPRTEDGITVQGPPQGRDGQRRLRPFDLDLAATPDLVPTLAVLALFADGPSEIRNVAHLRFKESDRLHALATELRRLGAGVRDRPDGLRIEPGPLHGARIETYRDHRMAMAFAIAGLAVPGVSIADPGCVGKSFPGFWSTLTGLARG